MHGLKSAILAKMKNSQNGTFEPVHEIRNFFWPKLFFWSIMKMAIRKFFRIMPQGPPNPGFMQEKVQKGDFLKKPSGKLKFFFCFRFEWIPWRPGTLKFFYLLKTYTTSVAGFADFLLEIVMVCCLILAKSGLFHLNLSTFTFSSLFSSSFTFSISIFASQ